MGGDIATGEESADGEEEDIGVVTVVTECDVAATATASTEVALNCVAQAMDANYLATPSGP